MLKLPKDLGCTGQLVSSVWDKRKIALISDSNVAPIYQDQVAEALEAVGFIVHEYQFPAGEDSKSLEVLADLTRQNGRRTASTAMMVSLLWAAGDW